jgi:enamine deaminase RidA (YjgF/YER057c/UK114 family)
MAHGSKLAPESWQTRSMTATDATPEPLYNGVPYDYASVVSAQSIIFTAGACPLDSDGVVVGHDNLRAQANAAFDNLVLVLAQHGAGAEHLVRTTIYVVGVQADLVEVWKVVEARLAPYRPPSTLLGVAALGYTHQLVEIDGVAALPPAGPDT